jgi:hypothetical protein
MHSANSTSVVVCQSTSSKTSSAASRVNLPVALQGQPGVNHQRTSAKSETSQAASCEVPRRCISRRQSIAVPLQSMSPDRNGQNRKGSQDSIHTAGVTYGCSLQQLFAKGRRGSLSPTASGTLWVAADSKTTERRDNWRRRGSCIATLNTQQIPTAASGQHESQTKSHSRYRHL